MTVEDNSKVDEFLQRLIDLESRSLKVGILAKEGGEILTIANVHEYGCDIPVTPKMRGYFRHTFGVSIRPSTAVIKIPERSFIRSSYDSKGDEVKETGADFLNKVIDGEMSVDSFYKILGQTVAQTIRNYLVKEVTSPPDSSFTIAHKGGKSNPLVNTGRLANSIDYEVI